MTEDQIREQRESLISDLLDVLNRHKTDIGTSLMMTDVIGALEWVKLEYYSEMK